MSLSVVAPRIGDLSTWGNFHFNMVTPAYPTATSLCSFGKPRLPGTLIVACLVRTVETLLVQTLLDRFWNQPADTLIMRQAMADSRRGNVQGGG